MVKRHEEIQPMIQSADYHSRNLIGRVNIDIPENQSFASNHSEILHVNTSLGHKAREVQDDMENVIRQVTVYRQQTGDYESWSDESVKSKALVEPVGTDVVKIKKQLANVEVCLMIRIF